MTAPLSFEDEYFDVLYSIEDTIQALYQENPELLDYNVDKALSGAVRTLSNQQRDRKPPTLKLKGNEQQLYDRFMGLVDLYTGQGNLTTADNQELELPQTRSIDDMIACFKRIQRSIKLMSDQGRQGYLDFVKAFFGG